MYLYWIIHSFQYFLFINNNRCFINNEQSRATHRDRPRILINQRDQLVGHNTGQQSEPEDLPRDSARLHAVRRFGDRIRQFAFDAKGAEPAGGDGVPLATKVGSYLLFVRSTIRLLQRVHLSGARQVARSAPDRRTIRGVHAGRENSQAKSRGAVGQR